jgi:hypothetical protein
VQWLLELGTRRVEEFQLRRPLDHVLAEGLVVERRQRSKLGIVERLAARKPLYVSRPTPSANQDHNHHGQQA